MQRKWQVKKKVETYKSRNLKDLWQPPKAGREKHKGASPSRTTEGVCFAETAILDRWSLDL